MTGPEDYHMNKNIDLSIIIPTYNEAATIGETLKQLNACRDGVEIIVVDGGSTDGTINLIDPGLSVITAPRGRANQMNAGARVASGEVLLFLHSDSRLPDNFRQQVLGALTDNQVVGGAFKVKINHPGLFFYLTSLGSNIRALLLRLYFGDQAIFVRRNVFIAMGGYPSIELMEDWELSLALRRAGKTLLLPGPVTTSARRWLLHGKWRTTILMHIIKLLYLLGVSPARLKRMYADRRQ